MAAVVTLTRGDGTAARAEDAAVMALHRGDGRAARAEWMAAWGHPAGGEGSGGEKEEKSFHGGVLNHVKRTGFNRFAGFCETFFLRAVIKQPAPFHPMKLRLSSLLLVSILALAACEKTPETQKAAEDAKKAGEAVKEAAKSGMDAAKVEAEAAKEAAAKKAAELKEAAEKKAAELKEKAGELKDQASEKASQAAGALEAAAKNVREALQK